MLYTASQDSYKIKNDKHRHMFKKNEVNTPPPYVSISCFGGSLCYPESPASLPLQNLRPLNDAKHAMLAQR
jgi:hypothetical protein